VLELVLVLVQPLQVLPQAQQPQALLQEPLQVQQLALPVHCLTLHRCLPQQLTPYYKD
jgi:hypothetical protein